jgi:hypothetical protein
VLKHTDGSSLYSQWPEMEMQEVKSSAFQGNLSLDSAAALFRVLAELRVSLQIRDFN